tara:strand:- start:5478 stop:7085 length:1608 start_codon:yes stop_codon:yes gene_type:complete
MVDITNLTQSAQSLLNQKNRREKRTRLLNLISKGVDIGNQIVSNKSNEKLTQLQRDRDFEKAYWTNAWKKRQGIVSDRLAYNENNNYFRQKALNEFEASFPDLDSNLPNYKTVKQEKVEEISKKLLEKHNKDFDNFRGGKPIDLSVRTQEEFTKPFNDYFNNEQDKLSSYQNQTLVGTIFRNLKGDTDAKLQSLSNESRKRYDSYKNIFKDFQPAALDKYDIVTTDDLLNRDMNNSELQTYLNDLVQSEQINVDQKNYIGRTMTNPEGRTINSIRASLIAPELAPVMTRYSNYIFNQETMDKSKGVFKNILNPDGTINKDTTTYYKWKRTIDPLARQNAGLPVTPPDVEDTLQDIFITIVDHNRQYKSIDDRVDNLDIEDNQKKLIKETFRKNLANDFAKYYERTTGEKTLEALKQDLFVSIVTTLSTDEEFAQIFKYDKDGKTLSQFVDNQMSILQSEDFLEANKLLGIEKGLPDNERIRLEAFRLNVISGKLNKTQIKNQYEDIVKSFEDSPNYEELLRRMRDIAEIKDNRRN